MFEHIYEKMDYLIMLNTVARTYKQHGINTSMAMIVRSIDISHITNDRGDNAPRNMNATGFGATATNLMGQTNRTKNTHSFFQQTWRPPNYEEESEEPAPPKIDIMAPVSGMGDNRKLQHRMRISMFNQLYLAHQDDEPVSPSNSTRTGRGSAIMSPSNVYTRQNTVGVSPGSENRSTANSRKGTRKNTSGLNKKGSPDSKKRRMTKFEPFNPEPTPLDGFQISQEEVDLANKREKQLKEYLKFKLQSAILSKKNNSLNADVNA